jgi:signal transduction histidine kinase
MLDRMLVSIKFTLGLIDDILDLAKLEQGAFILDKTSFRVNHVLKDIHEMFEIQTKGKGLDLDIDTTYGDNDQIEDLEIVSDKKRLKQVLLNLISNSLKFT